MNMTKRRFLRDGLWGVIAALALSSCASKPPLAPAGDGEFSYLTAGGLAYFYADVNLARPILADISLRGVDMTQTGRFFDKVDFITGAV
jgi:hypothetical protein